jgi:membrane dipeptidase
MQTPVPVFDGHNDTLLRLTADAHEGDNFFESPHGHIDMTRARRGGLQGGFFAVYIPSQPNQATVTDRDSLPPALPLEYSQQLAFKMTAKLFEIERESHGDFRIARSVADIRAAKAAGAMSGILHFEGAEAIDEQFYALEVFYQAGLRSIGPVWSRPTIFAEGVPFRHHHLPDTGPGLTALGKELIKLCNARKIMIDLSHMNEKGFWDVAKISTAPLVATHSNVWNLSQTTRNLTDKQLDAIRDSDGMVGLNFAVVFLREDGASNADTPIETMVDHIEYLVNRIGIDRVGLGSDFDGATIPNAIKDAGGLPILVDALRKRGYGESELTKICYENWMRVLLKTWGE